MKNPKFQEVIFWDGKFLSKEAAKIPVFEPGFLYGLGVFETMRCRNEKILYYNEHLQRLKEGCSVINIKLPYPPLRIKKIIKQAIHFNLGEDIYLRLTIWQSFKKAGFMLLAKKYVPRPLKKYKQGFSAGISSLRQDEKSFLSRIKSTNRAIYELSLEEAKAKGFDEAIIVNNLGYICEATRSNIFLVKGNKLLSPALDCGCLGGITRKVVFGLAKSSKIEIMEALIRPQDLYYCDEAFLTNSLIGIMPLTAVEGHKLGNGKIGPVTEGLMKRYNALAER